MSVWDLIGILGAGAIIVAYALLQIGRWQSRDIIYSACNALGAGMILASLVVDPNLPSILIECFWLAISLAGMVRSLRDKWRRH